MADAVAVAAGTMHRHRAQKQSTAQNTSTEHKPRRHKTVTKELLCRAACGHTCALRQLPLQVPSVTPGAAREFTEGIWSGTCRIARACPQAKRHRRSSVTVLYLLRVCSVPVLGACVPVLLLGTCALRQQRQQLQQYQQHDVNVADYERLDSVLVSQLTGVADYKRLDSVL